MPKKAKAPVSLDLHKILKDLKSDYADTICMIGDTTSPRSLAPDRIATGAINLDWATGGGIPTGRITELYSRKESEGKSTIACGVMREAQKNGAACLFLDPEQSTLASRVQKLGLDKDKLLYGQPRSVEHAFGMADKFIKATREAGHTGNIVVVLDSIASMNTEQQFAADYDKQQVASLARALSASLKPLNKTVADCNAVFLATNQVRQNIGVRYGETLITPGGLALKFYASLRIELRRLGKIYDKQKGEKNQIGIEVRATVKKSKVGMPFLTADLNILFASGVDPAASAFNFALQRHLVNKEGNSYLFKGMKKTFFRDDFGDYLAEHPELEQKIYAELDSSLQEVTNVSLETGDDDDDEVTADE